ncbi:hypothetical protein F9U64_06315 [Gracilibacillus oryzae]|uniref:ATP-dependent Lon protease n=1 Tax=Gracilibacillus oryzae TaxID=1672701 RepID=A0A7C8L8F5_9BACI|nr:hypothetical protein [Gracilibacillus oryzae]KAB8138153.1 hypothetical protein F9U64_06315 [Gracilibacillus oryzae]
MYILLSIILCSVLGYVLLMLGPIFGGIIAFGIVAGCLFRGIYLLNQINTKLSASEEEVKEHVNPLDSASSYKKYREERDAE